MRITRLLGVLLILGIPAFAGALAVPFVGSPFSHMSPPLVEDITIAPPLTSQTAATAAAANPGKNDICYSVSIKEISGAPKETYSSDPDSGCETLRKKYASDKAACQSGGFRDVAGNYSYTDMTGKVYQGNRCDHLPGDSSVGPSAVPASISATALSGMDVNNSTDQARMASMLQDQFNIPSDQALTTVQSDPQKAYNLLNDIATGDTSGAQQLAKDFNLDPNVLNATPGEFTSTSGAANTGGTGSLQNKGSYDQIRDLTSSVCKGGTYDCTQFQNSMIAVCQQESGCGTNNGSGSCIGAFQVCNTTQSYWMDQGIQNYVAACDPSTSACQTVQSQCTSGGDLRSNFVCNSAGAIGMHMNLESQIQATAPGDAATQAAIHEMYGLSPNQVTGALNSSDPLNASINAGRSNFASNGMTLPANATLSDGVSAVLSKGTGLQQGLSAASGGASGDIVTNVPGPAVAQAGGQADTVISNTSAAQPSTKIVYIQQASNPSISNGSNSLFNNPLLGYSLGSTLGGSLATPLSNAFSSQPSYAAPGVAQQPAAPPPPPPTLSLNVQPLTLSRGGSVGVSWTSSSMSTSVPCTVTQNGSNIGSGNTGSASIPTSSLTPSSIVVRLLCQASVNGQVYQQSQTVLLQ